MSYHIVSVDESSCRLSCKDNQLVCRSGEDSRSIPLEDVGAIVVTSFSASIHSHLILEASRHGIGFVLCDKYKPASLLLPANRCTDTFLTRAQVDLKSAARDRLWQKTINAKCRNQLILARHLCNDDRRLDYLEMVALGKHPYREAETARAYWPLFGDAVCRGNFTRDRNAEGVNSLLNYGYAVLLAIVLRNLFAVGIDPTFGIFHVTRERSTPLAYDLMEPFRPWVDWRVADWVLDRCPDKEAEPSVSNEFRAWMTGFALEKTVYKNRKTEHRACIEEVIRGFRKALTEHSTRHYQPWTPNNSKWVG